MTCTRRLTFCAGHRVYGHENKCANPHGHNYVAEITAAADLDSIGRVVDFAAIKTTVGGWIESQWDHAFLVFSKDAELMAAFNAHRGWRVYVMPVNPTAENMAAMLLEVCQGLLEPHGVRVTRVRLWETENCYAEAVPD